MAELIWDGKYDKVEKIAPLRVALPALPKEQMGRYCVRFNKDH
jgi:hypothetical protein